MPFQNNEWHTYLIDAKVDVAREDDDIIVSHANAALVLASKDLGGAVSVLIKQ